MAGYLALNVVTFVGTVTTIEAWRASGYSSSAASSAHHNCCFCDRVATVYRPATVGTLAPTFETNRFTRFDHVGLAARLDTTTASGMDNRWGRARSWPAAMGESTLALQVCPYARTEPGRL